jgi:tetratricopeptide (TPR) repeat protein
VAYPENERIQIETTTPIGGYYVFDQTFKQNYVKKLTDYKLISAVEYQTKSVDELFDKHFFKNENVDLTKLVGIQYLNSGLFFLDKREVEKAYAQFEKSYFFYPSEKSRYLMFSTLVEVFNGLGYSDEKKMTYLAKLCQYTKEGITSDMIASEFYRISQTVFIQDGDKAKYDKMYALMQESIGEKDTRNQISYIYHFENGRTLYNQGRHVDAQPYIEKALLAKPNNVDMTGLFIANLERLEPEGKEKPAYITQLQHYADSFPSLKENNNYTMLLAKNMLDVSAASYEKGNAKDGESYRLMFESLLGNRPNFNTNMIDFFVGKTYSAACMHYFKVGQKSKAKTIVEKGLVYAPNNYQLRSRREVLGR